MVTTSTYGTGGLAVGSAATVSFTPGGGQVDADIEVVWDFDGDGDFDQAVENVTGHLFDLETTLGRDWPSQVNGKAGPGKLRMTLDNRDNRFSRFNAASPLNQAPFSLDVGAKIRVRTVGAAEPDPALLLRDRFNRADQTGLGAADTGQLWTGVTGNGFSIVDGEAKADGAGGSTHMAVVDCGAADYYVQVTIVEPGDVTAGTAQQADGTAGLVYRYQDPDNYSIFRTITNLNSELRGFEVADVVAGVESIVDSGFVIPMRKEVTLGIQLTGAVYNAYLEGVFVYSGTALQTDETEVGIRCDYGTGNRAPRFDDFHVWSRMGEAKEGVLWTGRVTDVQPSVALGPRKTVTVTAEGVMADLAVRRVKPQGQHIDVRTGVSIGEALVKAGHALPPPKATTIDGTPYGWRAGDQFIGAYGYGSDGITALEHCRKVEAVEFGFLHETPEGWIAFHDRSDRSGTVVKAIFSDAGDQFGYSSIEPLDWRKEIVNHVTVGVSADAPSMVSGTAISAVGGAGVSTPVNPTLPASINEGDLLVAFFVSTVRSNTENWQVPLGWKRLRDTGGGSGGNARMQIYAKACDGTEDSTSVTFYADAGNAGGAWIGLLWLIRNWYGVIDSGVHVGDPARGHAQAGANPAAILPPWGVTSASLFLAQRTGGNESGSPAGSVSNPTYPLGYVIDNSTFQNGTADQFDCAEQHGIRSACTTIEDPTSFGGFSNIRNAEANIVAVRAYNGSPPEQMGRYLLEFHDRASQDRAGIRTHEGPTLFRDETDAASYANLVLATYARDRPIVRIAFPATLNAAYRAQAIRRRLGQKITLIADGDTGLGIRGDYFIENIAHRWGNAGKTWTVTWELSPA